MRISDWSSDVCSSDLGMGCLTYCPQRARRAAISGSALRQMTHISFLCGAAAFVGRSGRIGAARGRGEIQAEDNMGKGLQRKMLIRSEESRGGTECVRPYKTRSRRYY